MQVSVTETFERRLARIRSGKATSPVEQMLHQGIPMHLGGMTDPFPPLEKDLQITLGHLRAALQFGFPIIASTKSTLVAADTYRDVLSKGKFAVQISIPTIDDKLGREVDAGAPLPSERISTIAKLAEAGISVSCRVQPVLPGREAEVLELIDAVTQAGAKHVAVEHLKIPVERAWRHRAALNRALRRDIGGWYRDQGASRVGREFVLPLSMRLPNILNYRLYAKQRGLHFGAADSDLLHLSDGQVCCSSSDLLGLGRGFTYNYLEAIRRRDEHGVISVSSITREWRPGGSIARFLNSRMRRLGVTIEQYIRANWNGRPNGWSPESFYGVERTGRADRKGYELYRLSNEVADLLSGRGPHA